MGINKRGFKRQSLSDFLQENFYLKAQVIVHNYQAKEGDNFLGSVCPSVSLFVCALLFELVDL